MGSRTPHRASVLALLLAFGCSNVTQLVVVVDTDYAIPAGIDEIVVEVTGPSGELRQTSQVVTDRSGLPYTLTVLPAGEALGPVSIRAVGLRSGAEVAEQRARLSLRAGRSLTLRMFLARSCEGAGCAANRTCVCGECVPIDRAPDDWSGEPGMGGCEGDPPDAGPPTDAGDDPDAAVGCTSDAECDDEIPCTADRCDAGVCESTPDDALCTDGTLGMCIVGFGCQYDGCSPATCVAGPCQTARCDGDMCVLEPSCGAGEECCGDMCVAAGCDDGNPCTDDMCGAAGCENTPNTAACDDGVFCNGADTCSGGSCSTHAGDPCSGASVCDSGMDRCVGCTMDSECPSDVTGPWGSCTYADSCAETGTQSRTVTTYACAMNVCQPNATTENRACTRSTGGNSCGTTTFGAWGSCGGFGGACDESGTRSRTRTDRVCASGACSDSNSTDTGSCARSTTGNSCGTTTFGSWSSCGGFSGTCDETGTRSRTRTEFTCGSGACNTSMSTENGSCTRSTNGTSCGTTTYTSWSACGGFSGTCDETGTQSRTRTDFACGSGSCSSTDTTENRSCNRNQSGVSCGTTMYGSWGPCGGFVGTCDETGTRSRSETTFTCGSGSCNSNSGTDTGSCTRSTEGNPCESFVTCQMGTCMSGSCSYFGPGCSPFEICCEPGICINPGMEFCP